MQVFTGHVLVVVAKVPEAGNVVKDIKVPKQQPKFQKQVTRSSAGKHMAWAETGIHRVTSETAAA